MGHWTVLCVDSRTRVVRCSCGLPIHVINTGLASFNRLVRHHMDTHPSRDVYLYKPPATDDGRHIHRSTLVKYFGDGHTPRLFLVPVFLGSTDV